MSYHLQVHTSINWHFKPKSPHEQTTPLAPSPTSKEEQRGSGIDRTHRPPAPSCPSRPTVYSMVWRTLCCHPPSDGRRRRRRPGRGVWFRFLHRLELVSTVKMGVPKFYRWISERYPCLSEVVKEHQVGELRPWRKKWARGPLCSVGPRPSSCLWCWSAAAKEEEKGDRGLAASR